MRRASDVRSNRALSSPGQPITPRADALLTARAELAWLRGLAQQRRENFAQQPSPRPQTVASRSSRFSSPASRLSSPVSTRPDTSTSASSSVIASMHRSIPLVDDSGKSIPLTDWLVRTLLRRARGGVAGGEKVADALALRTILQRIDSRRATGEVTAEQLLVALANFFDGLFLARPKRLDFYNQGEPVGVAHLSRCFSVWNGGGKGRSLRYAEGDFRAIYRMLGNDYPRGRHALGKTRMGRYIADVSAAKQPAAGVDILARRFHFAYERERQEALELQRLKPNQPVDIGTQRQEPGPVQLTVGEAGRRAHGLEAQQYPAVDVLAICPPRERRILQKGGSTRIATLPATVRVQVPGVGVRDGVIGTLTVAAPKPPVQAADAPKRAAKASFHANPGSYGEYISEAFAKQV